MAHSLPSRKLAWFSAKVIFRLFFVNTKELSCLGRTLVRDGR